MLLAQNTAVVDPSQRRRHPRVVYSEPCIAKTEERMFNALAREISDGGMSIELRGLGKMQSGQKLSVYLEGSAPVDAIVRWTKDRVVGIQFEMAIGYYPGAAQILKRLQNEGT